MIVDVGINADVGALCGAPIECGMEDAPATAVGGNTVDGAVGEGVVEPCAVFYYIVGRIITYDEDKSSADMSLVLNDIAYAVLDIFLELLTLGIAVAPLCGVAVSSHLLPRVGEDNK